MNAKYDTIGKTYSATRAADPRITRALIDLLNLPAGANLLDVGAGTGNYSQALAESGYSVTALEPSRVMREQGKSHHNLNWIEGVAEKLPFENASVDGIVMTLCMHHFTDWRKGLAEALRAVGNGPIAILTFDAEFDSRFWLFDYFPSFLEKDKQWFPKIDALRDFVQSLGAQFDMQRFALPNDLIDHFAAAGWARPEIYLEDSYRSGISSFSSVAEPEVALGLQNLQRDLDSGEWDHRYGHCRTQKTLDVGYVFLKLQA